MARVCLAAALLAAATAVHTNAQETSDVWRLAVGQDTFMFRDVAKSAPPIDGAPVGWRGAGPMFAIEHARERPRRLHRFGVDASLDGAFVYDTGIGVVARPHEDRARFLRGRYDYRKYLARSLGWTALRAGIGLQGTGERRVLHRHSTGLQFTETDTAGSIAIVAALRIRPAGRWSADVEWANAAMLARGRQHHTDGDTVSVSESWGAGWISDLAGRLDRQMTERIRLFASYATGGEGWLFDLRAYTDERRRIVAGLAYVVH